MRSAPISTTTIRHGSENGLHLAVAGHDGLALERMPGHDSSHGHGSLLRVQRLFLQSGLAQAVEVTFEEIWIRPAECTTYIDELVIDTICVPEPATIFLLGLGGMALLRKRR